jgi:hypothetical protein
VVSTAGATGPFQVDASFWFQPIGFRWAHNLEPYHADDGAVLRIGSKEIGHGSGQGAGHALKV